MLPIIPLPYRIGAAVIIAAVIYGTGYWRGYSGEHDKVLELHALAKAQADETKRKDAENESTARAVADNFERERAALADALNRMRKSSSGSLPKATNSAESTHAASGESSRTCEGSTFYEKALKDAQSIGLWQEWAEKNNLPVE